MISFVSKKDIKKMPYNKEVLLSEVFSRYGLFWYDKIELELSACYKEWVEISKTTPIKIKRIKKTFWEKVLTK